MQSPPGINRIVIVLVLAVSVIAASLATGIALAEKDTHTVHQVVVALYKKIPGSPPKDLGLLAVKHCGNATAVLYGRDSLVYEAIAWGQARPILEECIEEALASYNESIENYYIASTTAPATPYRVVASSKAPAARPPATTTLSATTTTTPTKTTTERTANIEEHTKPATIPGSSKNYAVTTSIPPSPPRGLGQAERLAIVLGLSSLASALVYTIWRTRP